MVRTLCIFDVWIIILKGYLLNFCILEILVSVCSFVCMKKS